MAKLVALRRIALPDPDRKRTNVYVEPGDEFEPVSDLSRERLIRIGAAKAKGAKKADD